MKKLLFLGIFCLSILYGKVLWENNYINIGNGKHIWAKITKYDGDSCKNLLIGGVDNKNIYGSASNCSANINGYWAVNACGYKGSVTGGVSDAINKALELCSR